MLFIPGFGFFSSLSLSEVFLNTKITCMQVISSNLQYRSWLGSVNHDIRQMAISEIKSYQRNTYLHIQLNQNMFMVAQLYTVKALVMDIPEDRVDTLLNRTEI